MRPRYSRLHRHIPLAYTSPRWNRETGAGAPATGNIIITRRNDFAAFVKELSNSRPSRNADVNPATSQRSSRRY